MPSWSVSAWSGLGIRGQLSQTSPTRSPSTSSCPTLDVEGQLSWASHTPSPSVSWTVWTQPDPGSHESSVHGSPSSQFVGPPGTHEPPPQASPLEQASPSEQGPVLSVKTQPRTGSHVSSVQTLPSSQTRGAPGAQAPAP